MTDEPVANDVATPGRTPSLTASLFVVGTMAALILFSVIQFGSEVADGPLQVSMTLATLVALGVAYAYGHRGGLIGQAIQTSVSGTLGTMMVLLAIGALIGTLYLAGTVAAFIYYGVDLLEPRFYYVLVFIIASVLGVLLGSALTTIAAVGVAFVGLASVMGVDPAIAAGAALSGSILGDKVAKISDTVVLTVASVGGVSVPEHARAVMRTAAPAVLISGVLFFVIGIAGGSGDGTADVSSVQGVLSEQFDISLLAFTPVLLIFLLSALKFSAFLSLMIPAVFAVLLAAVTQHDLIVSLAGDPSLAYWEAALRVGISVIADGFQLQSSDPNLDQVFSGGGTSSMLTTIWLILVAASFGAIADFTGMLRQVITPVISLARNVAGLIITTMLTSIGLNAVAADPYISIVLVSKMFRGEYIADRLKPVTLSTSIADSGTIVSYIVPWNVNGALVAGTLGMAAVTYLPFAFLAYLTPIVSGLIAIRAGGRPLPKDEDAAQVYGSEPVTLPTPERTA